MSTVSDSSPPPSETLIDVAVIGQGIAGLTAANVALRAGALVATFENQLPGGLVSSVARLDPGPPNSFSSGIEYASELALDNLDRGVRSDSVAVTSIAADPRGGFSVRSPSATLRAHTVILATGARLRALDVPGASELAGRGVSTCADCDGPLFRGEIVVVVGAGDSACQGALVLADLCAKVILIRRSARFRAQAPLVTKVVAHPRIQLMDASIEAIHGSSRVEGVEVRIRGSTQTRRIECSGVFPFVGVAPTHPSLPPQVLLTQENAVLTGADRVTGHPGVWAVGAVRDQFPGLLAHAVEDAHIAARGAVSHAAQAQRGTNRTHS